MNSVPDHMVFPETPEEMDKLLRLEGIVKRERCFTHAGMNPYVVFQFLKEEGGEHRGAIARGILVKDRDAEGDRSADNVGVSVR